MERPTLRTPICDFLRIEYPILDHDLDAVAGTRP